MYFYIVQTISYTIFPIMHLPKCWHFTGLNPEDLDACALKESGFKPFCKANSDLVISKNSCLTPFMIINQGEKRGLVVPLELPLAFLLSDIRCFVTFDKTAFFTRINVVRFFC